MQRQNHSIKVIWAYITAISHRATGVYWYCNTPHSEESQVFVDRICNLQTCGTGRTYSWVLTSQRLFNQVTVDALKVVETKLCVDESLGERTSIPSGHLVKLVELGVLSEETLTYTILLQLLYLRNHDWYHRSKTLCILYICGQNKKLEKICIALTWPSDQQIHYTADLHESEDTCT